MSDAPVRIGVIGVGKHTRQVLIPALQLIPDVQLVVVATAHTDTAAAAQAQFGFPSVVGATAVLARADVEAVVIATPAAEHVGLTVAALQAGKHVFCETPGIRAPEEAQLVGRALRANGKVLAYGTCLRYAPIYVKLRSLIPEVRTADGVVLTARYSTALRHIYDLALYLLGVVVAAVTSRRQGNQTVALLDFAAGDLGFVHGGGPQNAAVPLERVEVSGPAGLLSARGARALWAYRGLRPAGVQDISFDAAPAIVWSPSGSIPYRPLSALTLRGYVPELEWFARAVRTGEPTLSGLDQAERTVRLHRAVARATEEARSVEVEPAFPLA